MAPSDSRIFAQHVRVSSAEDLSYTVPQAGSGGTNDVIQTIVTGRKCWKTMKGKGEVVWPPYLEAALVEGLEKYRPVETRSTRALGRFPMRNKFISDHIFNATGKRRTPKQVGSRLQQLRDTCEGKRILKLLSSRPPEPPKQEETATDFSTMDAPPCDHVTIDVLPGNAAWPAGDFGHIPSPSNSDPSSSCSSSGRPFNCPRPLRVIDPTVTFRSPTPITAQSSFRVLRDSIVIHHETTELEMRSSSCMPAPQFPAEMECTFLYSTTLVPRFWRQLCECPDLSPYSIVQDIIRASPPSSNPDSSSSVTPPPPSNQTMLSVIYHFNLPPASSSGSPPPHSPASSTITTISNGVDTDALSYSTESTPELGPEFDDMAMFNAYADPSVTPQSLPPLLPYINQTLNHSYTIPPPAPYPELPPDLIRDGEEGYASLPQSPMDFTFGSSIAGLPAGHVGVADHSAHLPDDICRNYAVDNHAIGLSGMSGHAACGGYDNVGVVNHGMLPSMHYPF